MNKILKCCHLATHTLCVRMFIIHKLCGKITIENIVVIGTAHPFKFSDTVQSATGINLEAPPHLKMNIDKKEKFDIIKNSNSEAKDYILSKLL